MPDNPSTRQRTDDRSHHLVERARNVVPGGAQTGLRSEVYDLGDVAFETADGATITTVDGTEFTDYHLAFGPIVLGHRDSDVRASVDAQLDDAVLFGAGTTELEVEMAERLVDLVPSIEQVNFCNSGSEATMHAIRLARAATGNDLVVKFEGCYHGWHDYVSVGVHPPAEAVGTHHVESAGIPDSSAANTVVLPFNDPDAVAALFEERGGDIAAVIMEPMPHSVGCLHPQAEFLDRVRAITEANDVPLIFDEVITGFRHSRNGMQAELGVTPDLTCLAKAMGNGYPVAAVGGREDLLAQAAGDHADGVIISGTYSGHPVGLAAANATLEKLTQEPVYDHLTELGEQVRSGLRDLLTDHGITGRVIGHKSIFAIQFGVEEAPHDYADIIGLDEARFREYAAAMRARGHFFTPNPYKRHHLSAAHTVADIEAYLDDAAAVLADI